MTKPDLLPDEIWVTPVPEKNQFSQTNTTAWLFQRMMTDVKYIRADRVEDVVRLTKIVQKALCETRKPDREWIECKLQECEARLSSMTPAEREAISSYVKRTSRADLVSTPNKSAEVDGETSDGYHTFNELYEHRHALFAALLRCYPTEAWKSKKHDDGTMFDGWFIAGIHTPDGNATYHIPVRLWDVFQAHEVDTAPKWDGHTPSDVITRIGHLATGKGGDDE